MKRGIIMTTVENSRRRRRKKKQPPTATLLVYFVLSIFFMETILRLSTTGALFSPGMAFSLIFALPLSIIGYGLFTLLNRRLNLILSSLTLFVLGLFFSSQLVYYKIFKTFYTLYSAGNAGQVLQFWNEALYGIKNNIFLIIVLFIPFVIFLFIGKKVVSPSKLSSSQLTLAVAASILVHFMALAGVRISDHGENSPYNLYYNVHHPDFLVNNLGLLTYTRLDAQRQLTGWSPKFADKLPDTEINDLPSYKEDMPIEYNVLDIDFDKLIANEEDPEIKEMHKYFSGVKPTAKNEYTGIYEGYNLIILTAEAFSHLAVDKDITPTLYKLVHEGYNFTNFYTPIWGVSTSDGEYVANTGLIPKSGVWSFKESSKIKMPFVMGNQLKKLGYTTKAYHNHTYTYYDRHLSHPNMGYEYKGVGNGLQVKETWPESDIEMMEVTIPEYINDQPFHTYYMTVSGHLLYDFEGNYIAHKNRHLVKDLPYSEQAKAYLATQIELDRALEYLLNQLEAAGIAEKTLIALSSDHYPYGLEIEEMQELAGKEIEENFELYRNAFILYTKGMEPEVIDKPASSLDIIPTISNLMGLEYDSRLFMGRDLFSQEEPLVIFSDRSFITEKGRYNAKDNIFIPNEGYNYDDEYRKNISSLINAKFHYSAKILETDYYSKILKHLKDK